MPWERMNYRIEEIEGTAIQECLAAIQSVYVNGGVILRSIQAVDSKEFERAVHFDCRGIEKILHTVISHPSVIDGIPELEISIPIKPMPIFEHLSSLGVEGEITGMLLSGGPYRKFEGSVNEARSMTRAFMEAILGPELQCLAANRSWTPWTRWFYDIAWDHTFIVSDYVRHRFILMCCTDTD